MRTSQDPRHIKRVNTLKVLFADSFLKQPSSDELAAEIFKNIDNIDDTIRNSAPTWPLEKLNKIDLAILRLAIYELQQTDAPPKVVIDEAVELAHEFGSDNSASFINGVLGTVYSETETSN